MADELGVVLDAEVADPIEQVEEAPEVVEATPEPVVEEVKGDERTMPQWMRNLKTSDPAAFKEAKGIFFGKRSLDDKLKDFDLDGTKGWLEEQGGRDAIVASLGELQGKAQELDGISQKMANGDPSLIADLVKSSPEGFAKLAPVVADQWRASDPEGWAAAMSGVMAATISENQVPMFLQEMSLLLKYGETAEVAKKIDQLKEWAGSFAANAKAPTRQEAKIDNKPSVQDERTQWESQKFNDGLRSEVENFRSPLIAKELASFINRRPADTDAKELAINTVRAQVIERMSKDDAFQKSLNALSARKDKDGVLRLVKSRETAAIAEIAPKVGRTIFGNPAPAKAETKVATVKPSATPGRAPTKFDEIWAS